jgi:perosamine synthetase
VETLVHYPVPLQEQPALSVYAPAGCPEAARAGRELLSLPIHPRVTDADAARVADAVSAFQRGRVLA